MAQSIFRRCSADWKRISMAVAPGCPCGYNVPVGIEVCIRGLHVA
ncbi:hypothetical protein SAMN05216535_3379 [Stutzerimonas xanthomarina]|uniref:Uncharacterized protein n=2 Tax=Stutzerimonas xanthomarina TaxID=271420 RepID=A0A1M5SKB9_9GAMM|nr:hypothetical protein SAMN05216535_3379 [Stutzerimonas xanthomarina]SHH38840.1 hypothetical protein SAMN02744645_3528 [Stutzerimonas xanthomarina DSM 18231]